MKEAWLFQGAVVPVDTETTQALVVEIKRLIDVVGGMALAQRTWVGLTDEEITQIIEMGLNIRDSIETALDKLKEKNT
jgi:hypothetical protein